MIYKFPLLLLVLSFCVVAGAQTPSPTPTSADEAKLKKEAIEFLRETSAEVSRLRTMENRISFSSELASLMWFHDEKEARGMYGGVISDFKQLLAQFDSEMNSLDVPGDDDYASGGLFGGYGRSKVERKFGIAMMVRRQIAMSLAEHAPDLAYGFFYDSLSLISNPKFRKETEQSDKYFEAELIRQIAETDASKAVEFGKESMKKGLDRSHIELLRKIYAKDADKGIAFGDAILSRLKTDRATTEVDIYDALLSFGATTLEASKKQGGKKPVYESDDMRAIAEEFAQKILSGSGNDGSSYFAVQYADQIEKYARPGRGAQIKAKFRNRESANLKVVDDEGGLSTGASAASNSNSNSAPRSPDPEREAREARDKAAKKAMDDIKNLGSKPLPKDQRDKVIADARKIIAQTPGKDKKLMALSMLADHVARAGDKDLADEIMIDAERLVNPEPRNYQDFLLSWMLAAGYANVNPDKAFPLLESSILRANETISAFVKVAEFIDVNQEVIDDGEVQVGMFGGSMVRQVTGGLGMAGSTIGTLSRADFTKTRNLTNIFDRTEIRVLAKMIVLRAVLDPGKKVEVDSSDKDESGTDNDNAPPPPMPRPTK